MATRVAVDNGFFSLTLDDVTRVARLVRGAKRFEAMDEIGRGFVEVSNATGQLPPGWGLLLDARDAPPRNDPEFEAAFAKARRPILLRFARVAVLVKTAAGKLQVQRYAREDGIDSLHAFDDEAEALAYLTGAPRASRPPR